MHGQCDARTMVTFPSTGHRRPLTSTKLYCLVTEAHVSEQLAQGCYLKVEQTGVKPTTFCVASQHPNHYTSEQVKFLSSILHINGTEEMPCRLSKLVSAFERMLK